MDTTTFLHGSGGGGGGAGLRVILIRASLARTSCIAIELGPGQ